MRCGAPGSARFCEADAVTLIEPAEGEAPERPRLLGVEAGLAEVARASRSTGRMRRSLRRGQPLILRGRDAPAEGMAYASCGGVVVAFGPIESGALQPYRVFNLPG